MYMYWGNNEPFIFCFYVKTIRAVPVTGYVLSVCIVQQEQNDGIITKYS